MFMMVREVMEETAMEERAREQRAMFAYLAWMIYEVNGSPSPSYSFTDEVKSGLIN